jgi:hypothetical protein
MNNSLNLIESAIADTESEIAKLDQLNANATTSRVAITKLENDIFDLHRNTAGLETEGACVQVDRCVFALFPGSGRFGNVQKSDR